MSQKTKQPTADELEKLWLERQARARERSEATCAVVNEEIGKLIDVAREDPDLVIDEEDTSVRRLAMKTGRSGSMAAVSAPDDKKS